MIYLFCEFEGSNVASYADDTTPYSCATDMRSVTLKIQVPANKLFDWFKNNHLRANQDNLIFYIVQ